MNLTPEFKSWLLRSDPKRPDPGGLDLAARERLVEQLEKAELETLCGKCQEKLTNLSFNPDQPRDEQGQWTDTGSGGKFDAAFQKNLNALGYKAVDHTKVVDRFNLKQLNTTDAKVPLSEHALAGIQSGLEDVKKAYPSLHEVLQSEVQLAYASYKPDKATAVFIGKPIRFGGGGTLLINGSDVSKESIDKAYETKSDFNIATRQAIEASKTPEDFQRELYRGAIVHELGHLADNMVENKLTNAVVDVLLKKMPGKEIATFLKTHVSPYAEYGGPKEAAAEIFTSIVMGRKLPPELDEYVSGVKRLLTRTKN